MANPRAIKRITPNPHPVVRFTYMQLSDVGPRQLRLGSCGGGAAQDDAAPSAPGLAPRAPGSNSLDPSQKFFNFDQMRPGDFPEFDSRGSVILGTGTASERVGNEYEWAVVDDAGDVVETPRRLIGFVVEGQD